MVEIVAMTLEDLPAVVEIERSSQLEPWSEAGFAAELEHPHARCYVARAAEKDQVGRVVGYICFWFVADEVQIFNLAVDPGHRRRGVGQALLRHALTVGCSLRARVAVLEVRRSNDAARKLYDSLGFRAVGERKDYYGGVREPAILMELELNCERCAGHGLSADTVGQGGNTNSGRWVSGGEAQLGALRNPLRNGCLRRT